MSRRNKITVIIIAITAVAAGVVLFLWLQPDETPVTPEPGNEPGSQLPLANPAPGRFASDDMKTADLESRPATDNPYPDPNAVIDEEIYSPVLAPSGQGIYALSLNDDKLTEYSLAGDKIRNISNQACECADIVWAPDKRKAFISDNSGPRIISAAGETYELNPNVRNGIFSADSDSFAYQYNDIETNENIMAISNDQGQDYRNLLSLSLFTGPESGLIIFYEWSPDNYIYLSGEVTDVSGSSVSRVNADTGDIENLADWGSVSGLSYSPDGEVIAVEKTDIRSSGEPIPAISFVDPEGESVSDLTIETFLNKCTWLDDSQHMVCALSSDFYTGQGQDLIFVYDLESGNKEQLTGVITDEPFRVTSPFPNASEDTLYFLNRLNRKLYSIPLP